MNWTITFCGATWTPWMSTWGVLFRTRAQPLRAASQRWSTGTALAAAVLDVDAVGGHAVARAGCPAAGTVDSGGGGAMPAGVRL